MSCSSRKSTVSSTRAMVGAYTIVVLPGRGRGAPAGVAAGARRRGPDRRRPAAHAPRPRAAPARQARALRRDRARPPRPQDAPGSAAHAPRASLRCKRPGRARVRIGPYNLHNAPTDPLGGPTPPPSLAAAARSGRGAGRARVLPRLPAALRAWPDRLLRAPARTNPLVGARREPARAGPLARLTAGAGVLAWLAVAGILILFALALTWIAVIPGLSAKSVDGAS